MNITTEEPDDLGRLFEFVEFISENATNVKPHNMVFNSEKIVDYLGQIQKDIHNGLGVSITVNSGIQSRDIDLDGKDNSSAYISRFEFKDSQTHRITLRNLRIGYLDLGQNMVHKNIKLINCVVNSLSVSNTSWKNSFFIKKYNSKPANWFAKTCRSNPDYWEANPGVFANVVQRMKTIGFGVDAVRSDQDNDKAYMFRNSLYIQNTLIAHLILRERTVKDFQMHKGCIIELNVPDINENFPTNGLFVMNNVYMPCKSLEKFSNNEQSFRNMRNHLEKLNNHYAANEFQVMESLSEREHDSAINNIFSRLYENTSRFGSSIYNPIILLIFIGIITFYYVLFFDNVTVVQGSGYTEKIDTIYKRSFFTSLNTIVTPWSIFQSNKIIIPDDIAAFLILGMFRIISTVLWALLILSIRKRFKFK